MSTVKYDSYNHKISSVQKKQSPDPRSKFHNDIKQIAQVYRQGHLITNTKRNEKVSVNSDPRSISLERSDPRNQKTLSQSRERALNKIQACDISRGELDQHNSQTIPVNQVRNVKNSNQSLITISNNNSSYGIKSITRRKLQGSKKRAAGIPDEFSASNMVNTSMLDENRTNTSVPRAKVTPQVQVRKGFSKSTLRSNLKSLNNNI